MMAHGQNGQYDCKPIEKISTFQCYDKSKFENLFLRNLEVIKR
jgi:hypothetical protein